MPRFLFGHKKSVPMLNETDRAIFTKACPRCGEPLGLPATWKNYPPPTNSNKEDLQKLIDRIND